MSALHASVSMDEYLQKPDGQNIKRMLNTAMDQLHTGLRFQAHVSCSKPPSVVRCFQTGACRQGWAALCVLHLAWPQVGSAAGMRGGAAQPGHGSATLQSPLPVPGPSSPCCAWPEAHRASNWAGLLVPELPPTIRLCETCGHPGVCECGEGMTAL